jgi:4-amino-4-deoxy-L-arabinose transferase-like glycosyltransferase
VTRRAQLVLVIATCALPRLAVLLVERGNVVSAFLEKSDRFATVFVHHGTFGFVPGEPSAYTQPLYGWFLIPVYWFFGRNWISVGLAQIAVAVATALLVRAAAARFLAPTTATAAAIVATLNPYLVWHDVHVNREITDQLAAATLVFVTLVAAERRSFRLAAASGLVAGIAILGNVRLAFLPVVIGAFLAWHFHPIRRAFAGAALVIAVAGLAVTPWLVRNEVEVGCWTLTTDARALWKANNPNTYRILRAGGWIDAVPRLRGAPAYTPQAAGDVYNKTGGHVPVNECAQMRLYERQVLSFWRHHPDEKAKLVAVSLQLLWDPRATETSQGPPNGAVVDALRRWGEGAWISGLYVLSAVGLLVLRRPVTTLILLLLAYQSAAAAVFVGTTRYRVPWDFLIAVPAAAAIARGAAMLRNRAGLRELSAK